MENEAHTAGISNGESAVRQTAGRLFLALALYTAVPLALTTLWEIAALILFGEKKTMEMLGTTVTQWIVGIGIPYLVGFPIFYLVTRGMPTKERRKVRMPVRGFLIFFFIAEAFMLIGALIGNGFTSVLSFFLGKEVTDVTSELMDQTPMWLIVPLVVLVGPLVEEIIFRKVAIDRLSRFGDGYAVLVTAIAFGIFHGNFYQFFYAAALGLVFGYVYVRTGSVRYSFGLHALVNFFGSVVTIYAERAARVLAACETADEMLTHPLELLISEGYSLFTYGSLIVGVVLFFRVRKSIRFTTKPQIALTNRELTAGTLLSVGAILFAAIYAYEFVISMIY